MNKKKDVAELLLFELLDKIARFFIHIEEIEQQFYKKKDSAVQDKFLFIDSFRKSLNKFILLSKILHLNSEREASMDDIIRKVLQYIYSINRLHREYLVNLPRPAEPLELRRFWRVIKKQVVVLEGEKDKDISIFISEEVGESAYPYDPLEKYYNNDLKSIIDEINSNIDADLFSGRKIEEINIENERKKYNTFHISIPRIDTNNPSKWPCLVHELSHKLFQELFQGSYFENENIREDFLSSLDDNEKKEIHQLIQEINLGSWLLESWCDLFAAVLMGPAFLFSQYSAFLNDINNNNSTHPPVLFRFRLIIQLLKHRFANNLIKELEELTGLCEITIKEVDNTNKYKSSELRVRQLCQYFGRYFFSHFFIKGESGPLIKHTDLNEKLKGLVGKYLDNLEWGTINTLINSLNKKLPIPSKKSMFDSLKEQPTSVQEIFLASCMYRNRNFKNLILEKFGKMGMDPTAKDEKNGSFENIIDEIIKFDHTVLRSIQISEWFDLYENKSRSGENNKKAVHHKQNSVGYLNMLCDYEIEEMLLRDDETGIKIIPIINFEKQLGSTSFDIRLGTSFEVYHSSQNGTIDFTDDKTAEEASNNSSKIDKDFLESITINPGQFMLGHSMEYIKLPENISGDLEGRSSFARLGIEIHMTAGFIDPGFEGALTFEIYNAGPNPVKLFPGLRIAQLRFIPVNTPRKPYGKGVEAKYRGLLEHHISKQSKDYEVIKLKEAIYFESEKTKKANRR
jgi:dCTP deaminase